MAKIEKQAKSARKSKSDQIFPFERENYIIMGLGLLSIILGYVALSGNQVEGFKQLTLAPILLVLGYCVIMPVGILYKKKSKSLSGPERPPQA